MAVARPISGTADPGASWTRYGLAANWYGYSYWNGKRDEDSGQFTLNATLSAGLKLTDTITGSVGILLPLYTQSWSTGGDSFDPATTFTFSVAKQF